MYKLDVQGRHCEIDDAMRGHIEDKIDHLESMWSKIDEAMVRLTEERGRFVAELTLYSGGVITRGEERAATARQAMDAAVDKLERQLQRHKKKGLSRERRHDNRDDVAGTMLKSTLPNTGAAIVGSNAETSDFAGGNTVAVNNGLGSANGMANANGEDEHVVRVKQFALKPMSPEEAALQMDLLGHEFFVFRDAQKEEVSVVYRRRGGGYGLIEPIAD